MGRSEAPASAGTSSGFKSLRQALGDARAEQLVAEPPSELELRRQEEREAERARRAAEKKQGAQRAAAYFRDLVEREDSDDRVAPEPGDCPTCRGVRFLRPAVPPDDPRFGKPVRCPTCWASPETSAEVRGAAGRAAGLAESQLGKRFGTFRAGPESMRAFRAVQGWAETPRGWLVVHGEPGCGKSHLAAAAVNRLLEKGSEVRYWYTPDLMDEIKHTIDQGGDALHWLLKTLKEQPIMVLDDVGAGARTEYAVETLEKLLDYRYREFLPTLLCLIGSPDEVKEHISESIGRRMQDPRVATVVHNQAPQWAPADGEE